MSQTEKQATAPKDTPQMPPALPEGEPVNVNGTTATVDTHGDTVTLHLKRVIKAPPEKIYNAFMDPDTLAAWLPPYGMVGRTHEFDGRVGGKFRMSFYTVGKSWSNTFGGTYVELVPNKKIIHTDHFESDDPMLQGEMRVTIKLTPTDGGTLLEIEQSGIPKAIAGGSPYGWSESLDKLSRLVEVDLPF